MSTSMIRCVVLAVLLLSAGAAQPASAFEHRCPAPGTEVRWSITPARAPIRYDGQDGLWCLRSYEGRPIESELGHFRFFARDAEHTEMYDKMLEAARELWPLEPGNHASFLYVDQADGANEAADVGSYFYQAEFSVGPPVVLSVRAGTYEALPISLDIFGQHQNTHHSQYVYYYAPDIGMVVKFEFHLVHGTLARQPRNWELVSIKLPPS